MPIVDPRDFTVSKILAGILIGLLTAVLIALIALTRTPLGDLLYRGGGHTQDEPLVSVSATPSTEPPEEQPSEPVPQPAESEPPDVATDGEAEKIDEASTDSDIELEQPDSRGPDGTEADSSDHELPYEDQPWQEGLYLDAVICTRDTVMNSVRIEAVISQYGNYDGLISYVIIGDYNEHRTEQWFSETTELSRNLEATGFSHASPVFCEVTLEADLPEGTQVLTEWSD